MSDGFATSRDGVPVAYRDHGGDGPPIVLLHGAGTHLLSLGLLARALQPYRVVAMDARWSGQSGDSDAYGWEPLIDDVEAVVDRLELGNPAIAGHSWGGMIAAHYGARHPETPAVANLDGHGSGDPSLYDGLDPEVAAVALEEMAKGGNPFTGRSEVGGRAWRDEESSFVRAFVAASGVPERRLDEWVERSFVATGPDEWRRHPSDVLFAGLTGDLRLFDLYRRVECPLLVLNCPPVPPGVPDGVRPLLEAYRRGLARALGELAAERPNVQVTTLPEVDHGSIVARDAGVVADVVKAFLAGAGYSAEG